MLKVFKTIPLYIWGMTLFFCLLYGITASLLWASFGMDGYDIGIFDQVLWNSSRGNIFSYSFNPYSYIVDHRSVLLLLLIPLYWIAAHPITLLVLQGGILASGIPLIYVLTRKYLANQLYSVSTQRCVASSAAIIYALHPIVWHMQFSEFHLLPFLIPGSFLAAYFLKQNNWHALSAVIGLILLVREDTAVMTIGIGLMILLFPKSKSTMVERLYGGSVILISSIVLAIHLWIGKIVAPFGESKFVALYHWAGESVGEVLLHWLTHPLQTVGVLLGSDHVLTIFLLLSVFAFLPLFAARWLIPTIIPIILFLLIQEPILEPVVFSHYTAFIFPWLCIAAVNGYIALKKKCTKASIMQAVTVSVIVLISMQGILFSPFIDPTIQQLYVDKERVENINAAISSIDANDAVMATPGVYSHLARRSQIYPTLHTMAGTYHFTDIPYEHSGAIDWLLFEKSEMALYRATYSETEIENAFRRFEDIITSNGLSVIEVNETIVVYGKTENDVQSISELEQLFFGGNIHIKNGSILPLHMPQVTIEY